MSESSAPDSAATEPAPSRSWLQRALVTAIRAYRAVISPLFMPTCRFHPTCSRYAIQAIDRFGAARGSWLAVKRVLRCHPLHPGGYDPVPDRFPGDRHPVNSPAEKPCGCQNSPLENSPLDNQEDAP